MFARRRGVADRGNFSGAYRERFRRCRVMADELSVEQYGVRYRLRMCAGDAGQRTEDSNRDSHARGAAAPYWRCIVHSVSMNMALLPGGVRRLSLVCL